MEWKQIGIIRTPYRVPAGTPIQPAAGAGVKGWVEVFDEFVPGLRDLSGFERVWLIYWFHRAAGGGVNLKVKPFLDKKTHGLFATRAPIRPNLIGISAVRLLKRSGNRLRVEDLDMVDGTPLLDIKPYVPQFDSFQNSACGWVRDADPRTVLADERFTQSRTAATKMFQQDRRRKQHQPQERQER
ncbi:MAG: tRNA (N6-threonylcarbamoyladenosine(37)-N6)-methyltransferase TrmO [Acidobacteriota bacterium]|jgi:tRNA-Thr(GGU) m(6)t(6)A37 methyltransferase TsaA